MAVSQLSPAQILGKIRYDPLTKKGSVLDVVRLVTGCDQRHASRELTRITDNYDDIRPKMMDVKFEGYKQKPTKAAHLSTLIEIAWLCPGRHAKEFRRTGAVTLCRALGGDLSLVEEVKKRHGETTEEEREAFLEGTGVTAAEANGQAVVPTDVHVRRYEAETARLEAEVAERRMHMLKRAAEVMRDEAAREKDDERHRLHMEDSSKNAMALYASMATGKRLAIEGTPANENDPITISEVAADAGLRLGRGDLVRAGKAVAAAYRLAYDGATPSKHKQFVDGATRPVNTYFEKDRALIERALRDTFGM